MDQMSPRGDGGGAGGATFRLVVEGGIRASIATTETASGIAGAITAIAAYDSVATVTENALIDVRSIGWRR